MQPKVDVAVVGGGAMGLATACALAARGRTVVVLERFEIGHDLGSSGGPTRIFRLSDPDPIYTRLAAAAHEGWRELEAATGETLLTTTGILTLGLDGSTREGLDAVGATYEELTTGEVHARWPGLRFEPAASHILYQEDGGIVFANRTVVSLGRLARERSVDVRENTVVESLREVSDGVEISVEAGDAAIHADVAVVTAGAWAGALLRGARVDIPLQGSVEQVSYYRLLEPSPLPALIDWDGGKRSADLRVDSPYAVPDPEHPGDFKVALHHSGVPVEPGAGPFEVNPEKAEMVEAWAKTRFGSFEPERPSHTCLYTNTPDYDFVLDRVGNIVVGSPCSGHGFKHVPLIGEVLADLATGTEPPVPLERFALERKALAVR